MNPIRIGKHRNSRILSMGISIYKLYEGREHAYELVDVTELRRFYLTVAQGKMPMCIVR